jgi:hypothetical protein
VSETPSRLVACPPPSGPITNPADLPDRIERAGPVAAWPALRKALDDGSWRPLLTAPASCCGGKTRGSRVEPGRRVERRSRQARARPLRTVQRSTTTTCGPQQGWWQSERAFSQQVGPRHRHAGNCCRHGPPPNHGRGTCQYSRDTHRDGGERCASEQLHRDAAQAGSTLTCKTIRPLLCISAPAADTV